MSYYHKSVGDDDYAIINEKRICTVKSPVHLRLD